VELSAEGIWVVDSELKTTFVNCRLSEMLGYSVEEIIGRSPLEFLPSDIQPKVRQMMERNREGGSERADFRLQHRNGKSVWVSVATSSFFDEQNRYLGGMAILADITDRKGADEALRETQARFNTALADSAVGTWIAHAPSKTIVWNYHLPRIFGISQGKAATWQDFFARIHPDDQSRVQRIVNRALQQRTVFELNFRVVHPGGEIRHLTARASVLRDEFGDPQRVAGVCLDITGRREDEERPRLQSAALNAAANAILITDRNGSIQWANRAACELSGYTHQEMLGQIPSIFRTDTDSADTSRQLWRSILSGQVWRGEVINRHKSGSLVHEEVSITPVLDQSGEVTHFIQIRQDITRRKHDEETLRQRQHELEHALADLELSRNREQRVLATIPAVCISVSEQDVVTHWNPAAERVLGISATEAVGKPFFELPLGWERRELLEGFAACRSGGGLVRLRDIRLLDVQNHNRILGLTLNCIEPNAGRGDGIVIIGADITDRRHLESQRLLAQKMESLGALAAGIAHEINTPTQYVGDNTRFLRDSFHDIRSVLDQYRKLLQEAENGEVSAETVGAVKAAVVQADLDYLLDETPKAIGETLEGLERVARIVRAMKDFSHPERDDKAPADLNQAIESTVTVSRHEWKYVAEVELDLDPRLPPVPCLIGGINQVVLNLVVNAAHAIADLLGENSPTKGRIHITTRRHGQEVEIRVTDTGAGIPDAIRGRIFDPFFTTKDVGKGTGQGLALAHNIIVEKHGGRIDVETEAGKGSTFIVRLPLERPGQPSRNDSAKEQSPKACSAPEKPEAVPDHGGRP
jgi:PAS domain S-box-containing protein